MRPDELKVLFVDDEVELHHAVGQTLDLAGIPAECVASGAEALERLHEAFPGVLVSDIRMPGLSGDALMLQALERDADLPVILVTGHGDVDLAVECMRGGAYDFIEKPYAPARLIEAIRRALEKRALTLENRRLREGADGDPIEATVIGRSEVMVRLRERVAAIAATDADVLVTGATGTGKEVVARAIHAASPRSSGPFVHVNCAALPESLVESELFGHEAGAFPGAVRARFGKFEHGRGGTVFLDEVDALPSALQAKLLLAIEQRTITRLGSNETVELDTRFIAASKSGASKGGASEAGAESLRPDLLYRLAVATVDMPLIAARRDDIPLLFLHLCDRAARRHRRDHADVPPEMLASVATRDWPGNVRELANAAERFVLGLGVDAETDGPSTRAEPEGSLGRRTAEFEKGIIAAALAAHDGQLRPTYEALGISRKTLYEKMQRHGLTRGSFSRPA